MNEYAPLPPPCSPRRPCVLSVRYGDHPCRLARRAGDPRVIGEVSLPQTTVWFTILRLGKKKNDLRTTELIV